MITFADNTNKTLISVSDAIDFVMPDTCTTIADGTLRSFVFLKSKTTLQSVLFSINLESIGKYAFYECSKLKSADFIKCPKLKYIRYGAFYSCSIEKLELPESITEIHSNAFNSCNFTYNFVFRPNLNYIRLSCFNGNNVEYSIEPGVTKYHLHHGCIYNEDYSDFLKISPSISDVVFHPNVTKISNSAFVNNNNIRVLRFPDSVNTIENWAIGACKNLEIIIFSPNINELSQYCLNGLPSLLELFLPEGINYIPSTSILNLANLERIHLPSNCSVTKNAFSNLPKLKSSYLADKNLISSYVNGGIPRHTFFPPPTCDTSRNFLPVINLALFVFIIMND